MSRPPRSLAQRALWGSWGSTALACLGVVVPKCPLCAAAYLSLFGLSASSARALLGWRAPLCVALIAGSTVATAWFVARRGRRLAAASARERGCCGAAR